MLGVDEWISQTGNTRGDFVPNPADMQLPAARDLGYPVTKNPVKQLAMCGQSSESLDRSTTVVTTAMNKFQNLWDKIDVQRIGSATRNTVDFLFEEMIGARAPVLDGDLVGRLLSLIDSRGYFVEDTAIQLFDMLMLHCGHVAHRPHLASLSPSPPPIPGLNHPTT